VKTAKEISSTRCDCSRRFRARVFVGHEPHLPAALAAGGPARSAAWRIYPRLIRRLFVARSTPATTRIWASRGFIAAVEPFRCSWRSRRCRRTDRRQCVERLRLRSSRSIPARVAWLRRSRLRYREGRCAVPHNRKTHASPQPSAELATLAAFDTPRSAMRWSRAARVRARPPRGRRCVDFLLKPVVDTLERRGSVPSRHLRCRGRGAELRTTIIVKVDDGPNRRWCTILTGPKPGTAPLG
jgi:hypothetical protein